MRDGCFVPLADNFDQDLKADGRFVFTYRGYEMSHGKFGKFGKVVKLALAVSVLPAVSLTFVILSDAGKVVLGRMLLGCFFFLIGVLALRYPAKFTGLPFEVENEALRRLSNPFGERVTILRGRMVGVGAILMSMLVFWAAIHELRK